MKNIHSFLLKANHRPQNTGSRADKHYQMIVQNLLMSKTFPSQLKPNILPMQPDYQNERAFYQIKISHVLKKTPLIAILNIFPLEHLVLHISKALSGQSYVIVIFNSPVRNALADSEMNITLNTLSCHQLYLLPSPHSQHVFFLNIS